MSHIIAPIETHTALVHYQPVTVQQENTYYKSGRVATAAGTILYLEHDHDAGGPVWETHPPDLTDDDRLNFNTEAEAREYALEADDYPWWIKADRDKIEIYKVTLETRIRWEKVEP